MSSYTNGGGTLTLPSPTHVHHVDVTSAVRSIRRSLSRSPSKFRLVSKSPSSSPNSPLSPSPLSPSKHAPFHTGSASQGTPTHTPSPLAKPFPPSVKLSLRSAKGSKSGSTRPLPKSRSSPKSPAKRALSDASDSGNATPSSSVDSGSDQENIKAGSISPTERRSLEKQKGERGMPFSVEITSAPVNHALSRLGDGSNDGLVTAATSSPLKRSDAIMNLDQASLGSPVAKRRSLHGSANFGHDFNIFDHAPPSPGFEIHEDSTHDFDTSNNTLLTASNATAQYTDMTSRRSSSLRRSTLQQRHGEKSSSWGRRHGNHLPPSLANELATPIVNKNRPRLSLDQFMPPMPRDSPFTSQGNLPSASVHMMNSGPQQPNHQPHPLSRTMTTSSSNSSLVDDSPTHLPAHFGEQPRPKLDFSKSLPAGALRPQALAAIAREESFATPENYKSVKPLPAAFMSTGLVSKVNRNPEEPPQVRDLGRANMPDTPCKRPMPGIATGPAPVPGSAIAKARHIRHSFGTPSTPFNPYGSQTGQGLFGAGVFSRTFGHGLSRRSSLLSLDGEENNGSPDVKGDSQSSTEYFPPTPTKQVLDHNVYSENESPEAIRTFSATAVGGKHAQTLPRASSKLSVLSTPNHEDADDSDSSFDPNNSPTPMTMNFEKSRHPFQTPLRNRQRVPRDCKSSLTGLTPKTVASIHSKTSGKKKFTKIDRLTSASPLDRVEFMERLSPHTPQEGVYPPDPSGLSISNCKAGQLQKSGGNVANMPPPATPTAGRGYFPPINDARASATPHNVFIPSDVDPALTSRFDKVELIGTGEFSHVYRVTQTAKKLTSPHAFFGVSSSPHNRSPPTPAADNVYAVKKSRQPYQGLRDRQRKLQEVNVLKALGQSDHVVHLIDSWEERDYLYIQTEFCEEGGLDLFLSQVGRRGRLDDFRIWKILLELGQGLSHIHDSGFIHLDLKPANILITFEGVLKIADFGMATPWPAQPGIEGEGDREYIGPEILLGRYDKPADVFALGLIMLEIAGNVQLPDNGPTWQRLRSGDMSDVPSLTWSTASTIPRDATGLPIEESETSMEIFSSDDEVESRFGSPTGSKKRDAGSSSKSLSTKGGKLFGSMRRGELRQAPAFMVDQHHEQALDRIVKWMISPRPEDRPTIHQVLNTEGVLWVEFRRRAGATVFEGNWGPADDVLADDAEMIDV